MSQSRPQTFLESMTPQFDAWKTFVLVPQHANDLTKALPKDPAGSAYGWSGATAFSVGHLQKHAPPDLMLRVGNMARSKTLEVRPPEWAPHAAAALLGEPLPPAPPNPVLQMMLGQNDAAGRAGHDIVRVASERMTTPLFDELRRAATEVETLFPEQWTDAVEEELRLRLAKFHEDEVVNWSDERNTKLYPVPRITKDELKRRHAEILTYLEALRSAGRGTRERKRTGTDLKSVVPSDSGQSEAAASAPIAPQATPVLPVAALVEAPISTPPTRPTSNKPPAKSSAPPPRGTFFHSEDCRWVQIGKRGYPLSATQGRALAYVIEKWNSRVLAVGLAATLQAADARSEKLGEVFKYPDSSHQVYKRLFDRSKKDLVMLKLAPQVLDAE